MSDFEKIIGYEEVKTELRRICDMTRNPEKYKKLGVSMPKGLLLFGEPGVGKTLMAECFIKATKRPAFICRKKKSGGEFVKEIAEIFEKAKKQVPCIVLLDDMDKYANEDEAHKNAEEYVTLQSCIDDVKDLDIFVVATANELRDVPNSLLRAGRFDKTITVYNPEGKDAEKIVAYYLSQKSFVDNIDAGEIARILDGKSCAELECVINEAGIYAGFGNKDKIEMEDLLKACLRILYHASEKTVEDDKNTVKIAYHEAGHVVLSELLLPGSVSLVAIRENCGVIGGLTAETNPDGYWYSKDMMENRVISVLGGKAATEITFGTTDMGANGDLHRAFDLVEKFVDNYCAYGFDKWIQSHDPSNDLLSRRDTRIAYEMENYYGQAKRLLIENRESLVKIANALLEEKILTGTKIRELLATQGE